MRSGVLTQLPSTLYLLSFAMWAEHTTYCEQYNTCKTNLVSVQTWKIWEIWEIQVVLKKPMNIFVMSYYCLWGLQFLAIQHAHSYPAFQIVHQLSTQNQYECWPLPPQAKILKYWKQLNFIIDSKRFQTEHSCQKASQLRATEMGHST